MNTSTLPSGALAYTRLTDTTHVLYGAEGIEGVLFSAESSVGTVDGEPHIFGAGWWLTLGDRATERVLLDAPPWDALAPDSQREQNIAAAREEAAAHIAVHRQGKPAS